MIKSTHKTIQDYFTPAALPSKRETAQASESKSFGTILQDIYTETTSTPPAGQIGLSIRDYMKRRLEGVGANPEALLRKSPTSSGTSPETENGISRNKTTPSAAQPVAEIKSPQTVSIGTKARVIQQAIQRAAEKYQVPAELIHSVIRSESNFKTDAVSQAGAQGLMQLMPATASDLGVTDPFDIQQNIDGGTRYLRQMLDRFGGNVEIALAAYNAGPGTVSRYGGMPPYRETQAYVKKVLELASLPETVKIS